MRIACDVLGTIEGDKKQSVLAIIRKLIADGHEVVVWSSEYLLAKKAVKDHNLNVEFRDKYSVSDTTYQDLKMFDLALEDDHGQTRYLAAKRFLMVDRIPYNQERALETIDGIVKEILAWEEEEKPEVV